MELSSEQPAITNVQEPKAPERRLVAPLWHTVLMIVVLVAFSFMGAKSEHKLAGEHGRIVQYTATILWEWFLVGYVWWGIRKHGVTIRELIRGRWKKVEDALLDVALAAGFWICAAVVLVSLAYLFGLAAPEKLKTAREQLDFLVPRTTRESFVWLALSCTAGFCEEVIFRGYMLRQFHALTNSRFAGVALQAVCFGAAHGYEGTERMVIIGVYGLMFGALAEWRRSLVPGMFAHAWHDALSGIAARFVPR